MADSLEMPPRRLRAVLPWLVMVMAIECLVTAAPSKQGPPAPAVAAPSGGQGAVRARVDPVPALMRRMTVRQKVGQLFMLSFDGTTVTPSLSQFLRQWQPGGETIFAQNVASPQQLRALDSALQRASHIPLLISVDQEGGEVVRITRGVAVLPSEAYYGSIGSALRVYQDTSVVGTQLRQLGINMNLAPVLDVLSNPQSPIDSRSFGANPSEDATLGASAIHGYQSHGVAATAKHFIGLGATGVNAENALPSVRLSPAALNAQLMPFRAAVHAGVDAIMVTHINLIGLTHGTPASLSYRVVTGIIRRQLGYRGVIMTDSIQMGAITGGMGIGAAAVAALRAGNDIVLIAGGGPNNPAVMAGAMSRVLHAVQAHRIGMKAVNASVRRVLELKRSLGLVR